LIILLFVAFIRTFRYNSKKAQFYILAITFYTVGVILHLLPHFGIVKHEITGMHSVMYGSLGELTVFFIAIFWDIRKINIEKNFLLKKTAQQEKQIFREHITGSEKTQKRISAELHDNVSAKLALIKNKLSENIGKDELLDDISEVFSDIKRISHRISHNKFHLLGCALSIKAYLDEVNKNSDLKIKTHFHCNMKEDEFNNETGLHIFRIVQESVQNCMKYAGTANVDVQITVEKNAINLIVKDDGKGFDVSDKTIRNGIGLNNMEMRAKILNGSFNIHSVLGEGTVISVTVPLSDSEK
jgi:signal transduction histidine kinase